MIRLADGVYSGTRSTPRRASTSTGPWSCGAGVVVDPPPHSPSDEAFLELKLKVRPTVAVVTNKHHLRDVQWWLERFRIPLAMHEAETNDYDSRSPARSRRGRGRGPLSGRTPA